MIASWDYYKQTDLDSVWNPLWYARCIVDYKRTWETAALPQTKLRAKTMLKAYKEKLNQEYKTYKDLCKAHKVKPDEKDVWIDTLQIRYGTKIR